jgi:hypothetical protein
MRNAASTAAHIRPPRPTAAGNQQFRLELAGYLQA